MDKKFLIIAKREYLERVRTRWFVIMTLLVPVLLSGALLFPTYLATHGGSSNDTRHITIIDATGAGLGDRIATALMADSSSKKVDSIRPRVINVSAADLAKTEAAATAEVQLPNHIVGYLVLSDSSLAGKSARYAGRNASSISDMERMESVVRQEVTIVRLEHEGVRADIVAQLAHDRLKLNSERLSDRGRSGSGESGLIAGIIVGIMLLMSIIVHGQNILRGVLEEKSTRVAEVVISSIKPEALLAGKVLGVGAVGLTQQVAWLAISGYLVTFLTPLVLKGSTVAAGAAGAGGGLMSSLGGMSWMLIGVALAYFIVGFVFYATLYAAAGSMVNSEQEAQQAAVPVMVLLMSTWLLVQSVIISPNSKLAVVLSWLPWSSPIIMPMRVGLTSVSPIEIIGSVLVALVGSVLAMLLSARIYRVGMLMYGKKPSLGELVKWIRYA